MPSIQSGKVLVTGANGYIAVWIVRKLLEQGFSVRGTVRSEKSVPYLKNLFASYGDKFELVLVPDIVKDGAFDEAVKGVDGILHTASPFHFAAADPSEIIDPAVRGTIGILESARKYGDNVKRITFISSMGGVTTPFGHSSENPTVVSEENWNQASVDVCDQQGKDAHPIQKYVASKVLGEKAAWDFVAKHKDELKFDIVTLLPGFVHGPFLNDIPAPENLGASLGLLYSHIIKGPADEEAWTMAGPLWVDVRDVADAHVLSLQKEKAGGHRFMINAGPFVWQEWANAAHGIDSSLPAGKPDFDVSSWVPPLKLIGSKDTEILGMKYLSLEQCTKDMVAQFKEKGWY